MNKLCIAIDMDEVITDPINKFIDTYQREQRYNFTLEQIINRKDFSGI